MQSPDVKDGLTKFQKQYLQFNKAILKHDVTDHFDITSGVICYDLSRKATQGATKPFLRVVQYKMVIEICRAIRDGALTLSDLETLPQGVVPRLRLLSKKGIFPLKGTALENVCSAYTQALHLYHSAERNFLSTQTVETHVNPAILTSIRETILSFGDIKCNLAKRSTVQRSLSESGDT